MFLKFKLTEAYSRMLATRNLEVMGWGDIAMLTKRNKDSDRMSKFGGYSAWHDDYS